MFSQLFIEERVEAHNLWKLDVLPGTLADHCIVKIYNLGSTTMSLNMITLLAAFGAGISMQFSSPFSLGVGKATRRERLAFQIVVKTLCWLQLQIIMTNMLGCRGTAIMCWYLEGTDTITT
jgi:hypothetical protein